MGQQLLYIIEFSTNVVRGWDDYSHFFDFDPSGLTMSDAEKGQLISYGENSTHKVVDKNVWENGSPLDTENS